jgi:hypothetical protein
LLSFERNIFRHGQPKVDIRILPRYSPVGGVDHLSGGIDAYYDRAAPIEFNSKFSIATTHVKNPATRDVAYKVKDQPAFESDGN